MKETVQKPRAPCTCSTHAQDFPRDAVPGGERPAFLARSPLHVKLLMEANADLHSPCLLDEPSRSEEKNMYHLRVFDKQDLSIMCDFPGNMRFLLEGSSLRMLQ